MAEVEVQIEAGSVIDAITDGSRERLDIVRGQH
jgi:hypothetical protein